MSVFLYLCLHACLCKCIVFDCLPFMACLTVSVCFNLESKDYPPLLIKEINVLLEMLEANGMEVEGSTEKYYFFYPGYSNLQDYTLNYYDLP